MPQKEVRYHELFVPSCYTNVDNFFNVEFRFYYSLTFPSYKLFFKNHFSMPQYKFVILNGSSNLVEPTLTIFFYLFLLFSAHTKPSQNLPLQFPVHQPLSSSTNFAAC